MESITERGVARGEWRAGWPVLVAAMIGIGAGPGLFQNLSSLFVPGIIRDFGWSRGDIATAAAMGLFGGLLAPFLGRLVDRVGARAMIVAGMALLAAVYVGFAAQTGALWQYQALIFGLALTVPGTSSIVYGKLIAARFVAHRGIALAVATSGISITSLALAPVIGAIIAAHGWRGGYVALAVGVAGIALPLVLIALRNTAAGPTRPDPDAPAAAIPAHGLTGGEARRDSRFWRLGTAAMCINIGSVGLVTQLVPFGGDRGLSGAQAALLVTSFAASQVVGRILIGVAVDRFRPQATAAAFALASAAAFVGLQFDAGFAGMMALVFLAGLMNGAESDLLPFLTARLFGLRAYGEIYGTLVTMALFGNAIGIIAFGRSFDATGDYALALGLAAVSLASAGALFATLGDRALPDAQGAAHPA